MSPPHLYFVYLTKAQRAKLWSECIELYLDLELDDLDLELQLALIPTATQHIQPTLHHERDLRVIGL